MKSNIILPIYERVAQKVANSSVKDIFYILTNGYEDENCETIVDAIMSVSNDFTTDIAVKMANGREMTSKQLWCLAYQVFNNKNAYIAHFKEEMKHEAAPTSAEIEVVINKTEKGEEREYLHTKDFETIEAAQEYISKHYPVIDCDGYHWQILVNGEVQDEAYICFDYTAKNESDAIKQMYEAGEFTCDQSIKGRNRELKAVRKGDKIYLFAQEFNGQRWWPLSNGQNKVTISPDIFIKYYYLPC